MFNRCNNNHESSQQKAERWNNEKKSWKGKPSGEQSSFSDEQLKRYAQEAKEQSTKSKTEYKITAEQRQRYALERKEWGFD